ncbi:MAG: bifunctional phosphoribosyl-AMP cyclohydrolase/phosphoribosyl-ATP diphosphatase HisIE [Treponemataceae bacterium]|nr:bifunctional phosphoribosyl-AMP cyclohydrolase/phosphoribosyl-ATP diphosphatase HisIE [Spirochaetales bacterium]MDY6030225.1 bifunctional phosphoribosyl-AMP cyclohydrolase/phosphoribosyl-ATP diphosphatase HisIE [Treponemataceae bacterium]
MVISSIDLKDGKVVQLKNGKEKILERDNADELIKDFDKFGETAIIDLDAAMGNTETDAKGRVTTANTELLKSLLHKSNVRVGGGIRSAKQAKELISLGAEKVIIGSAAWATGEERAKGEILNKAFLEELAETIGKQRIIISVDAIEGIIAIKGWKETNGIPLIKAAKEAEKYCSELLFTCVEKEGCMQGTNLDYAKQLRQAVKCRVVVAGGVSTLEEIITLEKMGCDVQLGMALYTGKVSLKDAFIGCLNWEKCEKETNGLVSVIAQSPAGEVLMMGYANRDAFEKTFASGKLTFWSRSRNELWTKGETSGNFLRVIKLRADCDRDTVLATVDPVGPSCHTGSWTCFTSEADAASTMERLYGTIAERFANPRPGSYTATLDHDLVREKVEEEAEEVCEADNHDDVVWECADLMYFLNVLMYKEGVTWKEVMAELDRRHKK